MTEDFAPSRVGQMIVEQDEGRRFVDGGLDPVASVRGHVKPGLRAAHEQPFNQADVASMVAFAFFSA